MAERNPTGGDAPRRADPTTDLAESAPSALGSTPGAAPRPGRSPADRRL